MLALFAVLLRADQIITGTAVTLAALGLTGALYQTLYGAGGAALATPTIGPFALPGLAAIPVIARTWARPGDREAPAAEPTPEEARRLEDELRRLG